MINKIIQDSIDVYINELSRKICVKNDELLSIYNPFKHKRRICSIENCRELIINKEEYCEKHYNKFMLNNVKKVNNNIENNELEEIEENVYKDYFGLKFKIVDNKIIKL